MREACHLSLEFLEPLNARTSAYLLTGMYCISSDLSGKEGSTEEAEHSNGHCAKEEVALREDADINLLTGSANADARGMSGVGPEESLGAPAPLSPSRSTATTPLSPFLEPIAIPHVVQVTSGCVIALREVLVPLVFVGCAVEGLYLPGTNGCLLHIPRKHLSTAGPPSGFAPLLACCGFDLTYLISLVRDCTRP